jgi:uncharacterized protein
LTTAGPPAYAAPRVARRKLALTIALAMFVSYAFAADTARTIPDRRKALDDGERRWDDRTQTLAFKIVGRGAPKTLGVELSEKRYPGDERKSILFFSAPPAAKGMGFLAFIHKGKEAERWIYLGERIRQISGTERDDRFLDTDFAHRDLDILVEMTSWTEGDAVSSLHGEETVDGVACHVIDLAPKRTDIGYRKITLWLGHDDLVPRKLEFFEDDAGEPARRIHQSDIRRIGAIPVAYRTKVETPSARSTTEAVVVGVKFDQHLTDAAFTRRALEQGAN